MKWSRTDPRQLINKRANIVINYQTSTGVAASTGFVDTKEGWYIHFNSPCNELRSLHVDDKWPEDWWWCFAPNEYLNDTQPLKTPMEQIIQLAKNTLKLSEELLRVQANSTDNIERSRDLLLKGIKSIIDLAERWM